MEKALSYKAPGGSYSAEAAPSQKKGKRYWARGSQRGGRGEKTKAVPWVAENQFGPEKKRGKEGARRVSLEARGDMGHRQVEGRGEMIFSSLGKGTRRREDGKSRAVGIDQTLAGGGRRGKTSKRPSNRKIRGGKGV